MIDATSPLCSETWQSCVFTAKASRQGRNDKPGLLSTDDAILRLRLVFEEALELAATLGFRVSLEADPWCPYVTTAALQFDATGSASLWDVIDACADLHYVTIGTLATLGVPDTPHIQAVIDANDAKFPNGQGVPHPSVPGKYGKPDGWTAPDHHAVMQTYCKDVSI